MEPETSMSNVIQTSQSSTPTTVGNANSRQSGNTARVWAGAVIVFAGLALIVLGGCFLIGVILVAFPTQNKAEAFLLSPKAVRNLVVCLYALAFACFAGAVIMIRMGLRHLLQILRG
jgi:hypothetical protein